jgi:hypothetical protein
MAFWSARFKALFLELEGRRGFSYGPDGCPIRILMCQTSAAIFGALGGGKMWGFRAKLAFAAVLALLLFQARGPKPGEEDATRAIFEQVRLAQFEAIVSRLREQSRTQEKTAKVELVFPGKSGERSS